MHTICAELHYGQRTVSSFTAEVHELWPEYRFSVYFYVQMRELIDGRNKNIDNFYVLQESQQNPQ